MKKMGYRQCVLRNGDAYQTAWIPQKFARDQAVLKILEAGQWVDGWVVETVGAYCEHPMDVGKAIRQHRDQTGDSDPKR